LRRRTGTRGGGEALDETASRRIAVQHFNTAGEIKLVAAKKAFTLTAEMTQSAAEAAAIFKVCPSLHDHDQLLGYFIHHANMPPVEAVNAYFSGGHGDAQAVIGLMEQLKVKGQGKRILEFASGYGRVTRHLKVGAPDNTIFASDIHQDACTFIQEKIGVVAIPASTSPADLRMAGDQDLIVVLSLFSHLPEKTFGPWLSVLYGLLAPGGFLMFTTHGEFAMRSNPEFFRKNFNVKKGFGFRPESDQNDLNTEEYGTAVVSIPYVRRAIKQFAPDAAISPPDVSIDPSNAANDHIPPRIWFGLQDQWIIQRPQ
jgi:SAM-dependent methyltransferase